MQSALLKIYGIFIIVTVLISSLFLYTRNSKEGDVVTLPLSSIKEEEGDGIIVPPPSLQEQKATSSQQEDREFQKITEPVNLEPSSQNSPLDYQQQTAIDVIPTDNRLQIPNPCTSPIMYTVGTFDTRFNISKSYFIQKLAESSSLWNDASTIELFKYTQEKNPGTLIVNLIYDERQQRTDTSKLRDAEIKNSVDVAMTLKKEYETMKETFLISKEEYIKKLDAFNTKQKTYNDSITYWNERGGAPRQEYDQLMLEKEQLQKDVETLKGEQTSLNSSLEEINAKITRYNELVAFSNEKVDINNSIANKKFTEGDYDPNTNKITIYQFADEIKLHRVLTHEFGHALGIDHTKSKDSIMYAVNSATSTSLNYEDLQEVRALCQ